MVKKGVFKKGWLIFFAISLLFNGYFLFKDSQIFKNIKKEEVLIKKVTRIIDGDTFDTDKEERIRLKGVQAPEWPKGCLSQEAKLRLQDLILGREVTLKEIEKDNFGRLVAFIYIDELFVDKALIEEGLAQASSGENPRYGVQLLSAEESAQKAKRGIWSSACLPKNPQCKIKGNIRSDKGTKIYHLPQCFNYQKIVINEREGDRWFCSEKEAESAGFTKSNDCPR